MYLEPLGIEATPFELFPTEQRLEGRDSVGPFLQLLHAERWLLLVVE